MNLVHSKIQIENMADQGLIDPTAFHDIIEVIEYLIAQCTAMRDNMATVLSVVIDLEEPGGPFHQAQAHLVDADVGQAELEYRQALEEAARATIEMFGQSEAAPIKRLLAILEQSPALFLKTDRLSLFLDQVLAKTDTLKASEFSRRWDDPGEQRRQLERMIEVNLQHSFIIEASLDHDTDQVFATITPKGFDESAASSTRQPPEKDRLYWLLSEAADLAMGDAADEVWPMTKEGFEESVMENMRHLLAFQYDVTEHTSGRRSTIYGVKLKATTP